MTQSRIFPDLSGIKGVLIDLDNTLYPYEPAHQAALQACYSYYSELDPVLPETFKEQYRQARQQVTDRLLPQGACRSRLFAFQMMCEAAGVKHPYTKAYELNELYWGSFINNMSIYNPVTVFLAQCKHLMIPVCVVTDMTTDIQIRKLERLKITQYIAHLTTSEEVGAEKPDPRMFYAALQKLGIEPKDAIMIGDDRVKDLEGASACGIRAHYLSAEVGQESCLS